MSRRPQSSAPSNHPATKRYVVLRKLEVTRAQFTASIHQVELYLAESHPAVQGISAPNRVLKGMWSSEMTICGYIMKLTSEAVNTLRNRLSTSLSIVKIAEDRSMPFASSLVIEQTQSLALSAISYDGPMLASNEDNASFYKYDREAMGEGVLIVFLDTRLDVDHPELYPRATNGPPCLYGYIQDIQNGHIKASTVQSEYYEHGTAAASLAAGRTTGTARKARILGIQIVPDKGNVKPLLSDIIDGMFEAHSAIIEHNGSRPPDQKVMKGIISVSIGSICVDQEPDYKDALEALDVVMEDIYYRKNALVIVSAGNKQEYMDVSKPKTTFMPQCSRFTLTVGSVDKKDNYDRLSNYGPGMQQLIWDEDVLIADWL
ncbi:subtilisin-like protein [Ascobolus immersus RN42]|uniref:Subtilisin-like protein n=1 Tax=Ascobolus immersus RN42 TaxID=1160509 RepID=A0A3N4IG63_ASCIM|nr:subtilisin-like protein [Ascobolus immersus RN42]